MTLAHPSSPQAPQRRQFATRLRLANFDYDPAAQTLYHARQVHVECITQMRDIQQRVTDPARKRVLETLIDELIDEAECITTALTIMYPGSKTWR